MCRKSILHIALWAAGSLLGMGRLCVNAEAQLWDGGGTNNNWSTANNWNANAVPANDGTANVGFRGTTRLTPTINIPIDVLSITFVAPAGQFDITNDTFHNFLTVGAGGITNNDDSVQTISCPMRLSASQVWTAASGNLAINAVDGQGFAVTISGASNTSLDRLTGTGTNLTKNGAGTLSLTGSSTFSGGVTLNAGVISVDADSRLGSATGTLVINGGGLNISGPTFTTQRNISLAAAGATINAASTQFSQNGGTLAINAGSVTNGSSFIGFDSGSNANATIDSAASTWIAGSNFAVGYQGNGTLSLSNGATLTSGIAHIGSVAGSIGQASANGTNSAWTSSGFLGVGYGGSGVLNINNGAAVSATSSFVGADLGSDGEVNVSDSGSTWTVSGSPVIGEHGAGTLSISAGATVSNQSAFIGRMPDGHGDASISDFGSQWTNDGDLTVGSSGTGTLIIASGGLVTSTGDCQIGGSTGSHGEVTVDGLSSLLDCANLYVGFQGAGTLQVLNGGHVTSDAASIAGNVSSSATIRGTASAWQNAGEIEIGDGGPGSITIDTGGSVSNTNAYIGRLIAGTGTATITDSGSLWSNSGSLIIGCLGGNGSLSVLGGADVTSGQASIGNSNGSGNANVDGSGSTWNVGGTLGLGFNGNGTMQITNGASVSCLQASLGFGSGANATLAITGALSILNCGALGISMSESGASSTLNLLGGIVNVDGNITDGGAGTSALTLDGATLDMQNHAIGGAAQINNLAFRSGTLKNVSQINNGAGLTKTGPDYLYLNTPNTYTGSTSVNQGTLFVVNTTGSATGTGGVSVASGASLAGPGRIGGQVQNNGIVTPAGFVGSSIGTLTIQNTYTQNASGSLSIEIGGSSQNDRLAISGAASLSGILNVSLVNGFVPSAGDNFTILSAASIVGTFSTTNLPALPSPLAWQLDYLSTSVRLRVTGCNLGADIDADNDVDIADLTTLLAHFGTQSGATRADGDLNNDGAVDLTDLTALLGQFGESC